LSGLTETGRNWITNALDPFHDDPIPLDGIPDRDLGDTAIQYIKRKVTIKKPANVTGTWDCHITSLPLLTTIKPAVKMTTPLFGASNATCGVLLGDSLIDINNGPLTNRPMMLGTVVAYACRSGDNTWPEFGTDPFDDANTGMPPIADASAVPEYYQFDAVNRDDLGGMAKLIGGGFEVHNVTPELYKSGSVTAYMAPQQSIDQVQPVRAWDAANSGGAFTQTFRTPPANVAQATQYPNSRTWNAGEGCVCPMVLEPQHSTFQPTSVRSPLFRTSDVAYDALPHPVDVCVFSDSVATSNGLTVTPGHRAAPVLTTGCYFTGLSPETVLTMDVRFVVERRPTAANEMLLSLSSPPARYDPAAIEFYSRLRQMLPPGAPVSWNETGEWWRQILRHVGPAAKAVAPFLPPPYNVALKGAGNVADLLAELKIKKQNKDTARTLDQCATKIRKMKLQPTGIKKKKKVPASRRATQGRIYS
jgi:hypothetical protein